MSNDCCSVDTEECSHDEEVNCVFCGKLFPSVERVQEHISMSHEAVEISNETLEQKIENVLENKQLKVFDLNSELIVNKAIDYNCVVQCSKCDLLFVNVYASRIHFEKVHLGRKRRRSNNPNGEGGNEVTRNIIFSDKRSEKRTKKRKNTLDESKNDPVIEFKLEGIIVNPTGSDDWGCDICGRQFPTLKQAKVHKFKSHIEPLQKKKMMIYRNILRKTNVSQKIFVKKLIAESKFREILPNSKRSKIDKSVKEESQVCNNNLQNGCHEQRSSLPATGRPADNLWRAAQATSRGNKIVISRVYQNEILLPSVAKTKYGFLQKNGYNCFYCREIFLNKENFKRHLLLHRLNKCYKCRNCGSKFPRVKMLKQHQRHNCHIEFITTSGPLELNGIVAMKIENRNLVPKITSRDITQVIKIENQVPKNIIVQHKEDEVSPRDIKFAEKFLNNSSITLNKGSQCVCNLCQSCFYSNNSILRHLVLYHRIAAQDGSTALITKLKSPSSKLKQIQCEVNPENCNQNVKPTLHFIHNCDHCGSQFASKKGLQRHLYSVHMIQSYDGKYKDGFPNELHCSECNLSFNDSSSFDIHKEECSGLSSSPGSVSQRIKCDACGRTFMNLLALEEHKKMYENGMCVQNINNNNNIEDDMIYKGNTSIFMNKSFGNIKTEEKVKHRGGSLGGKKSLSYTIPLYKKAKVPPNAEGLFECDVCHKTFTCRSSLSNHVKSHFNFKNKPFSCSSCNQGFMSTLTLQHHREQLCPNINNNNNNSDPNNSAICSTESVTQTSIFSSFDGVSQIPGSNYTAADGDRTSHYVGNSNLTTRATSCMHCSAMFPDRSLLEDHASKEHSNHAGEVVCIICPRSFTTYMAFRVHMTKSHGGPNGTSLKSHLNTTNSIMKTNTSFELIQELSTSLSKEYSRASATSPNGKMYNSRHSCPNCDKDFSTSQALGNHKRACMPHLYKKVSL